MTKCTVTGTFGLIVQTVLAVLVLFVLLAEFGFEWLASLRNNKEDAHRRSFRQFWFDSYKV